jgi:hypothetical protein
VFVELVPIPVFLFETGLDYIKIVRFVLDSSSDSSFLIPFSAARARPRWCTASRANAASAAFLVRTSPGVAGIAGSRGTVESPIDAARVPHPATKQLPNSLSLSSGAALLEARLLGTGMQIESADTTSASFSDVRQRTVDQG